MPVLPPKLDVPLSSPHLPSPIMFRSAQVPAGGVYPQHQHAWGEFVYSFSGIMEVKLADRHYLAPPQYGVWLPPEVVHVGLNRLAAHHGSLYIAPQACQDLPRTPCALTVSPLVRALLDHLRHSPPPPDPRQPVTESDRLRVVKATALLEAGQTVESIALDLGYGSASAFIAMFKRLMKATPHEFRKGGAPGPGQT